VYPEWMTISAMRDEHGQVTHYLGNFSDLSDAKAAENRIQWLSHFDSLTGLPNRALLKDRTRTPSACAARRRTLAMMLVALTISKPSTTPWVTTSAMNYWWKWPSA